MSRSALLVVVSGALAASCGGALETAALTSTTTSSTSTGSRADTTSGLSDAEAGSFGGSEGSDSTSTRTSSGDGDGEAASIDLLTLAYGADPVQTLDLFRLQPSPPGPLAIVILGHGGLWQAGDKLALTDLCEAIVETSSGTIACASINYRLSQDLGGSCRGVGVDSYVEQVADFAAAYATLQAAADRYGLDLARMYIGGHSAGGHLGHSLNLRWSEFSSACADFGGCVAPAGAIGVEGIYDVAAWNAYDAQFWNGQFACATRKAFGGPPDSPDVCLDDQQQAPCWHMGSPTWLAQHADMLGLAPVGDALIVHSPDDDWVDIAEATSFGAALNAAFPQLSVITVTDGSCGSGSHEAVLYDSALVDCIVNFVG